jgi:hypothetical protein
MSVFIQIWQGVLVNEAMNASRYEYMQVDDGDGGANSHGHAHGSGGYHSAFDRGPLRNWCAHTHTHTHAGWAGTCTGALTW